MRTGGREQDKNKRKRNDPKEREKKNMHLRYRGFLPRDTGLVSPPLGLADQGLELVELGDHAPGLGDGGEFFLQARRSVGLSAVIFI